MGGGLLPLVEVVRFSWWAFVVMLAVKIFLLVVVLTDNQINYCTKKAATCGGLLYLTLIILPCTSPSSPKSE